MKQRETRSEDVDYELNLELFYVMPFPWCLIKHEAPIVYQDSRFDGLATENLICERGFRNRGL